MKVVIKLTRGGHSEINAEPTDTIRVVKTKIKESPAPLGFAVDSQKIICSGKVLKDDNTLESYGFSENAKDNYLVLIVNQKNSPTTVLPNALTMPTSPTNTATISSAEPDPSNSGVLTPSSVQSFAQSSAVNHVQSTPTRRTAQIVCVGPDGDQKVLTTLEGSQIDDFEQLRSMGFSTQATVEAYLCCDMNVAHAATYLSENSDANSSETSVIDNNNTRPHSQMTRTAEMYGVDSTGDKKLLATLEGSQVDYIEALLAMGYSQQATVEAYLACNKNAQLAASFLVEHGAKSNLNFGSGDEGAAIISDTPLALPSTSDPKPSLTPASETSGSLPTPSQKSLGKRPERPWSPHSNDDRASKKTRTSENSASASSMSSSMASSPPTSYLAEVSSTSEPMIIDDSEMGENFNSEEKATINKLEEMGFPREAVVEAICVCNGDEGCIVEYLCEKGYEI